MFGGPLDRKARNQPASASWLRGRPLLVGAAGTVLSLSLIGCGRPAPELASTEGVDATSPSAVGVRAVSVETVVPAPPTSSIASTVITAAPAATGAGTYIVESGDTLSVIADRFGVSLAALSEANNITDPDSISPGQELTIPGTNP